jgi:uncharacterized protein
MNFTKYNTSADTSVRYDAGLRAYMLHVFNLMSIALVITGVSAYFATFDAFQSLVVSQSQSGGYQVTPFGWAVQLAPLFMVFFFSFKVQSMSLPTAKITFWAFSVLMGLSLGQLCLMYTEESIARTFFITASVFGSMSIYGYTTKKDLSGMGSFLMMGVIGLVIASVVNMFMQSSGLEFAISVIGVLAFTGLTAWDVQKIKNLYLYTARMDANAVSKSAILGALTLYLDFINLFIFLLRLFGGRKD